MQAVILAAGESSRFYPYNSSGHKSLVALGGKTLLSRTIQSLKKAKISNIIIVENMDESASKALSPQDLAGIKVTFVIQEKPTGMGDALLCAAKYLENSFFVLNAYHFETDMFIEDMMAAQKNPSDAVLLTKDVLDASGFGAIILNEGKKIVAEKAKTGSAERIVGLYLLNKEFVSILHSEAKNQYNFEAALSRYSQEHTLVLVKTKKETLSLKYPWDLLSVKNYFLSFQKRKISKNAKIAKSAQIKGDVVIDDDATIMDGAVVLGPCYIGRNSYVGTNSIIRGGVCVEEKAVVGAFMEVKNSIIMKSATTHSGFIGDSIIGEKSKIAAGFDTANIRLDRKEVSCVVKGEKVNSGLKNLGVMIGSNCSIGLKVGTMPGVIIGNNSKIGPGTMVMENVESNVTYYTRVKGIVKKKNTA